MTDRKKSIEEGTFFLWVIVGGSGVVACLLALLVYSYVAEDRRKVGDCECWHTVFTLEKKNEILRKQLKLLHNNLVDSCNPDDCQCLSVEQSRAKEI